MKRIPKNRLNQAYWDARDSITDDWIKEQIENDKDFADKLQKIYDEALKLMQDDIYREYSKVSSNRSLAQQKVSQADIKELEKYAEKVVPKRDFSDEANKRMRLYNATMRINRLEMLKSQLGYELINAGLKVDDQLKNHLNDEYQAEIERQAGIFGATVAPKPLLTNKHVASVVMAGVNGVDFSKRLWTDQDLLKAKLDGILIQVATTGKSNQEMARKLVGLVSDAVKKSDTLLSESFEQRQQEFKLKHRKTCSMNTDLSIVNGMLNQALVVFVVTLLKMIPMVMVLEFTALMMFQVFQFMPIVGVRFLLIG